MRKRRGRGKREKRSHEDSGLGGDRDAGIRKREVRLAPEVDKEPAGTKF